MLDHVHDLRLVLAFFVFRFIFATFVDFFAAVKVGFRYLKRARYGLIVIDKRRVCDLFARSFQLFEVLSGEITNANGEISTACLNLITLAPPVFINIAARAFRRQVLN